MANLIRLSINQLEVGCFVAGVGKQKGEAIVKQSGWIKSAASIEKLKKMGIVEVIVDRSKSLADEAPPSGINNETPPIPEATVPVHAEKTTFNQEIKKANAIYKQAKQYQKKMLRNIKDGVPIDIGPASALSDKIIDSVFRNNDALSCLTRIRNKDDYLLEHSVNVGILMSIFAKHMKYAKKDIKEMTMGGLLHDLGKIKIDEAVLNKPGKLTDAEFELMKKHASFSREILQDTPDIPKVAMDIASYHHERMDGSGYPFKLDAGKLSEPVKMIAICDVYDAITADRCYKNAMNPSEAFGILLKNTPNHFDPVLVQQFIKCMGLHPVGSLVKLQSGKLGIVVETNDKDLSKPVVKVFYNTEKRHHIEVKLLDLSSNDVKDKIATAAKAETYKLDINQYF